MSGDHYLKAKRHFILADSEIVGPTPDRNLASINPTFGIGAAPTVVNFTQSVPQTAAPAAIENLSYVLSGAPFIPQALLPTSVTSGNRVTPYTTITAPSGVAPAIGVVFNGMTHFNGSVTLSLQTFNDVAAYVFPAGQTLPFFRVLIALHDDLGAIPGVSSDYSSVIMTKLNNFLCLDEVTKEFLIPHRDGRLFIKFIVLILNNVDTLANLTIAASSLKIIIND